MEITVTRHEDEGGHAEDARGSIHPALRGVLARPLLGKSQAWSVPFDGWLEPPRPVVKLLIDLEGGVTADGQPLPGAWVGGLEPRPTLVGVRGTEYASIDVELTPLGAFSVLGMPLGGQTVALDSALGPAGAELAQRVREADDWHARLSAVQSLLIRRVDAGPRPTPAVARAWQLLEASDGRMRIGAVAREIGMSRRYLGLVFGRETGMAPKTAARLLRFVAVRRRIDAEPARWADIAATAGYADQSHLNREFRELTGLTPSAFLGRKLDGGGYAGSDIPFVQDERVDAA